MSKVYQWFQSRPRVIAAGFLLVLLIGLIGYLSGPVLSFGLFYLAPVILVSWLVGGQGGVIIAVSCGLAWFIADISWPLSFSQPWTYYFNLVSRTLSFVLVALLVAQMKLLTGNLEKNVELRTSELQTEIAERRRTELKWREREELFRQLAENINEVFWMTTADRKQAIYISPGYERIWGHTCASLLQSPGSWMASIHPEDRARVERALAQDQSDQYNVEYRITRPDGSIRWIRDRGFPIHGPEGRIYRIAGIAEDITEPKLTELALLEISDREQARIGQDLHDGLCQLLVSIGFDCNLLEQRLQSAQRPEQADLARIGMLLDDAITQARQLARGLYPVRLEAEGLTSALEELAANVTTRFKIKCDLRRSDAVSVADNTMATQLYRIAQEAVNNAVRHSQAVHIVIRLIRRNGNIELVVRDDGIGIPAQRNGGGMGLHIMDYRARTLGGTLHIEHMNGGGTAISCSVPLPSGAAPVA